MDHGQKIHETSYTLFSDFYIKFTLPLLSQLAVVTSLISCCPLSAGLGVDQLVSSAVTQCACVIFSYQENQVTRCKLL